MSTTKTLSQEKESKPVSIEIQDKLWATYPNDIKVTESNALKNKNGTMCCLGFVCKYLDPEMYILDVGVPSDVDRCHEEFETEDKTAIANFIIIHQDRMAEINDNPPKEGEERKDSSKYRLYKLNKFLDIQNAPFRFTLT